MDVTHGLTLVVTSIFYKRNSHCFVYEILSAGGTLALVEIQLPSNFKELFLKAVNVNVLQFNRVNKALY